MNLIFHKATLSNLDEIFSLVDASRIKMISENIFQWDEIYPTREDFEEDIKRGELTSVVHEESGKIAAIYVINSEYDDAYNYAKWTCPESNFRVLHRIVVNPEFQNKGIGTSVMRHLMEDLKSQGVESLRLDVFSENPYSQRMYAKLGFVKTGEANWRKGLFYLLEKVL